MAADWVIGVLVVSLTVVVLISLAVAFRVLGVWRLAAWCGLKKDGKEEKQVLTQGQPGYMVQSDSGVRLDSSSQYAQYGSANAGCQQNVIGPHPIPDSAQDASPVSSDSVSIVSEVEALASGEKPPSGGVLRRAMSCDSVASDSSVMEYEPEAPKIGQLEFGLEYDREVSELVVSVIQARDLECNESCNSLDSYVTLWLKPHQTAKCQTKVQRGTSSPIFKERFLYTVDRHALENTVIFLQVYSSDKYARHKMLGETDLRLGDINIRQPIRIWMNLRDLDEKQTDFGDVMFSLSYLPTAERLTVVMVKARSLKWCNDKTAGNCFVKVYLLQNGKKICKKKTSMKRDDPNPIFNEAMIFSVPATMLPTVQLTINVMEVVPDHLTSIGHVIVGSELTGTELSHWNQMMTSLRKPVAMWHRLKK